MPSAALQSRINMFEHGSTSPPSKQHILETPISPKAAKISSITPSLSSSPEIVTKSSLLEDWVIDDGSPPRSRTISPALSPNAPLISFQSPPRSKAAKAPPLPPRKPSYNSLRSVSSSSSGSQSLQPLPRRNDSLTVDYSYPPDERKGHNGFKPGHMPASSISSFHSVSLSSDGDPLTPSSVSGFKIERHDTGASTNESFEEVSASSIVSPSTAALLATQIDPRRPPKLPRRPSERTSSPTTPPSLTSSQISTNSVVTIRRPPPPRPNTSPRSSYTSSDRSSVLSAAASTTSRSSTSSTKKSTQFSSQPAIFPVKRPTPIPQAARLRFESVFEENVRQRRRAAQQQKLEALDEKKKGLKPGWRGLSVDLITNPPLAVEANADTPDPLAEIGPEVRLEAYIVKSIWSRSKLNKAKLKIIWDECDTQRLGSLDREGFIRGMWRIDEELGRARLKNSNGSTRGKLIPPRNTDLLLH